MTTEEKDIQPESLGQFLHRTREAQGLEITDICNETKISASNLRAIEDDNYSALPADAFTKGFYTLYARSLDLDPEEILARFVAERGSTPRQRYTAPAPPQSQKASQKVSSMAEPSSVSPVSTIGFVLLLLIIIAGGLFWFFDINPATYISEKIRGIQEVSIPNASPDVNLEETNS